MAISTFILVIILVCVNIGNYPPTSTRAKVPLEITQQHNASSSSTCKICDFDLLKFSTSCYIDPHPIPISDEMVLAIMAPPAWPYGLSYVSIISSSTHVCGTLRHFKYGTTSGPAHPYPFLLLLFLTAGDIELNPGPSVPTIFPCGYCEKPVKWENDPVCCDAANCNMWHHRSCIELCSQDSSLLHRSNVQWHCVKCHSINVESFTFHSFVDTYNYYSPRTKPHHPPLDQARDASTHQEQVPQVIVNLDLDPYLRLMKPTPTVNWTPHQMCPHLMNQTQQVVTHKAPYICVLSLSLPTYPPPPPIQALKRKTSQIQSHMN